MHCVRTMVFEITKLHRTHFLIPPTTSIVGEKVEIHDPPDENSSEEKALKKAT